jgi:hypothetical protein
VNKDELLLGKKAINRYHLIAFLIEVEIAYLSSIYSYS